MELLLQAPRAQDYARRMGTIRCHGRWIRHRYSTVKCVNPVATNWTVSLVPEGQFVIWGQ